MSDRVELVRTGGFAGRTLRASVRADELDGAAQAALGAVLEHGATGTPAAAAGRPDRYVYELTVRRARDATRLVVGEAELDDRLRPLVESLERIADPDH